MISIGRSATSISSDVHDSTENMANPVLGYWHRLYSRPTLPEMTIEPVIASLGIPYRFQHILMPYVADFAFPTLGIILEVDGSSHDSEKAKEKDRARDEALAKRGWRTVRVSNERAMSMDSAELRQLLGLGTAA